MTTERSSTRRAFLKSTVALGAFTVALPRSIVTAAEKKPELFKISLAQWSLNKRFLKRPGAEPLDNLEFAKVARSLGIDGVDGIDAPRLLGEGIDEGMEGIDGIVDGMLEGIEAPPPPELPEGVLELLPPPELPPEGMLDLLPPLDPPDEPLDPEEPLEPPEELGGVLLGEGMELDCC